jgi:UDP-glucuronate decarboxylase
VKELSRIILELTGSKSEITYMQLPSDDPKKRNPDIRKAKKYLNWEPKFSLEEGLKETIVYFRELYEKELKALKNPESTSAKK